jgi:hypothetical protein
MKKLLLGLVLVLGLVTAAPASALVTSYNEPAYTKATTENKNWFSWLRTPGVGSTVYFHCVAVYKNGILDESYDVAQGTNCTPDLVGQSANTWYSPGNGVTPLTDGAFYETCVLDFRWNSEIWQSGPTDCGETRIDRNKPGVTVYVNGTDTYTNNPNLTFRIDYGDATSPPWPANYRCFGTAPCGTVNYDPNCSVAVAGTNTFICSGNASASPDGPLYFCALAADSAIPDVNGTNAFFGANSSNANLSDVGCGSITLDRVAPAVTAGSDATTVKSGQLVSFSAGATDGMSGLSGPFTWTFGDNTAGATGANVTHTYTQTGTFVASAVTHDGAGNTGTATRTITVEPGGGTTTGGTTTGGTTSGGGTFGGPTTATGITKQPGVGATQTQSVGDSLDVIAPKKFALKKGRRTLPVALTIDRPGKATLALVKGGKVVARAAATFTLAGTFGLKMKLPKKLKAGKYKLKISFTPAGTTKAATKSLPLKITGKASASAAAAAVRPRVRGGAPYEPEPVQRSGIPQTDLG